MAIRYKLTKGYVGDTEPFGFNADATLIGKIQKGQPTKWISKDPASTDYQDYLAWVAECNEPETADE